MVDKNVKLAEENKTLHGIIEANKDIEEEMGNQNQNDCDLENDEVFAEQMITVNGLKYRRTTSTKRPESKKKNANDNQENLGARTKNYKCARCDQSFLTMGLLKRHTKEKHTLNAGDPQAEREEPTILKISCKKCDYQCETNEMMKQHMEKEHITRQNITCNRCNYLCEC